MGVENLFPKIGGSRPKHSLTSTAVVVQHGSIDHARRRDSRDESRFLGHAPLHRRPLILGIASHIQLCFRQHHALRLEAQAGMQRAFHAA